MDNTLIAARLHACRKAPYLSHALFALRLEERKNVAFHMRVGADRLCEYSEENLTARQAWNVPNLAAILVHEVWHVLRRHFVRAEETFKGVVPPQIEGKLSVIFTDLNVLWNMAADLAINDGMFCQGFSLPAWGLFADQFGWDKFQTAEFYFKLLLKASKEEMAKLEALLKEKNITPDDFAKMMRRPTDEAPASLERRLSEKATAERMREHATKQPGTIPGDQERWAGDQLAPAKVRWEDELRHGLRSMLTRGDMDYSWRRTNRRKQGDLIFPGMAAHRPSVCIVEDTSGSMGSKELQKARNETAGVLRTLQSPVTVLCCDAAIAGGVQKIYNINQLKLVGGGGTDMSLGLTEAVRVKPKPEVVVCLTDGYTGWPEKPPANCKFLTVLVGDGDGPSFGKVIRVQ